MVKISVLLKAFKFLLGAGEGLTKNNMQIGSYFIKLFCIHELYPSLVEKMKNFYIYTINIGCLLLNMCGSE